MTELSFWLETAWWGFWGCAFLYVGASWAWDHRPWAPTSEQIRDRIEARHKRAFETKEVADLEGAGVPIWRPDPARVRQAEERL